MSTKKTTKQNAAPDQVLLRFVGESDTVRYGTRLLIKGELLTVPAGEAPGLLADACFQPAEGEE